MRASQPSNTSNWASGGISYTSLQLCVPPSLGSSQHHAGTICKIAGEITWVFTSYFENKMLVASTGPAASEGKWDKPSEAPASALALTHHLVFDPPLPQLYFHPFIGCTQQLLTSEENYKNSLINTSKESGVPQNKHFTGGQYISHLLMTVLFAKKNRTSIKWPENCLSDLKTNGCQS